MRVGLGYDVHALVDGRRLFLGGVEIPHHKGLEGHSDGDVLIHAISDAMLGAIAEGDIGLFFPDTDESIHGIDSAIILRRVSDMVKERGFMVANIDAVVSAEEPRILPYRGAIRENLARILDITPDRISVKGKTTERLGFVGRREGIEVHAVALLAKRNE
jgi:2-C-methyl-D-erythritol 2,4-cyclodiphosphate synthase